MSPLVPGPRLTLSDFGNFKTWNNGLRGFRTMLSLVAGGTVVPFCVCIFVILWCFFEFENSLVFCCAFVVLLLCFRCAFLVFLCFFLRL